MYWGKKTVILKLNNKNVFDQTISDHKHRLQ